MRTLVSWVVVGLVACGGRPEPVPVAPKSSEGGELTAPAGPKIVSQEVSYRAGDKTLRGYLAWDSSREGKRPGVIVVHEWWGLNDYARTRARMLAEAGYTALALDLYGDGKTAEHPKDAQAFAQEATSDLAVASARFNAALDLLKAHQTTDESRTAAIGYCFGGSVVLDMARSGADLDAAASFHGVLSTLAPAKAGATLTKILVATGEADPFVPPEQVAAFEREMQQAGADYQLVKYPGAKHAFTNPAATANGERFGLPLAYDAAADADSWQRLLQLLATTFAAPELTPEQRSAARKAAEARGNLARLQAETETERARWTDEMHAAAKALAETKYPNTAAALKKILASAHRMPGNPERDKYRHPERTMAFFGIKPTMTVFEYGPGAGWYTELLAPLLAARGKLIANNGNPDGPPEARGTYYARRYRNFLDKAPELYGKVQVVRVDDPAHPALGLTGTVDMALVIRGYHGWESRGTGGAWLAQIHQALKPGGILGVVEHRAAPGTDPKAAAAKGRMPQQALIDEVQAAGFKLVAKSEMNANPKDTRDHPEGVWTLPPTLRLGDTDRAKYLAIGESDRMTLKFRRVAKKASP